jgi:hypothetical protein
MNKHIELVKKWLADPESVSLEELEANREAATVAAAWYADFEANKATCWASKAAIAAEVAACWAVGAAVWASKAAKAAIAAEVAACWAAKAATAVYRRNQAIKYIKEYEELTK